MAFPHTSAFMGRRQESIQGRSKADPILAAQALLGVPVAIFSAFLHLNNLTGPDGIHADFERIALFTDLRQVFERLFSWLA